MVGNRIYNFTTKLILLAILVSISRRRNFELSPLVLRVVYIRSVDFRKSYGMLWAPLCREWYREFI